MLHAEIRFKQCWPRPLENIIGHRLPLSKPHQTEPNQPKPVQRPPPQNPTKPNQFYGSAARPRFFDLYRLVHRQKQTVEDEALEDSEFTPRRRFLRDSLTRGRSPSPTVLRSKIDPHFLDLGEKPILQTAKP